MAKRLTPSPDFDPIFNRLIELSYGRGSSPSNLCDQFASSRSALNAWKKGNISANLIVPICEHLDISIEYLLTGKGEEKSIVSTGDIKDNHDVNINSNNTVQLEHIGELETEIIEILSRLDTRSKTELMSLIYKYTDECKSKELVHN